MKKQYLWAVLALAFAGAGPAEAQLITNGGFEGGTTGQFGSATIPNWLVWGSDGWHHGDAGLFHGGSLAIKTWSDTTGIYQDFSAAAGLSYDVSSYALSGSADALTGWDGVLKVEWFQTGVGSVGTQEVGRFEGSGVDPLGAWKLVSGTVVAPTGADQGRLVMHLVTDGAGPRSGSLNWDDASVTLTAIPEPSSVVLLGLGLAAIAGLRRRFSRA